MPLSKENEMTAETTTPEKAEKKQKVIYRGGSEAVYGLGLIGAAVFYISHATTFWLGVLGFLKAIVWPALLVYEALKFFG
jgi:TM2 domain-containing membrane protein YozV